MSFYKKTLFENVFFSRDRNVKFIKKSVIILNILYYMFRFLNFIINVKNNFLSKKVFFVFGHLKTPSIV